MAEFSFGFTEGSFTAVGRKLYLGGHDKEKFVEQHYFLRLQKQFPEKWEAHAPSPLPVPTALSFLQLNG